VNAAEAFVRDPDSHGYAPMTKIPSSVADRSIVFVSSMAGSPWGGSEELWSQSAQILASEGVQVGASVHGWLSPHARILELARGGIDVQLRTYRGSIWRRLCQRLIPGGNVSQLEKFLIQRAPDLVVLSDGGAFNPIGLLEFCASRALSFVTVSHVNNELFWPDDELATRYRKVLPDARRCYFVSEANRALFEKQLGCAVKNAEVIRNPFNVDYNVKLAWPGLSESGELRLACVARLHPPSKGHDLLLEALADATWTSRNWHLTFYGEGPMRNSIERMVQNLGLQKKVSFAGHVASVKKIWAENHVLVLPSRYEGMPLALVEAMLCGRTTVATDVAEHSEIIDDGVTGFLADAPTASSIRSALGRLWARRSELQSIGMVAAERIRQLIPADPIRVFTDKIKALAGA
jgi:glycosyltransferase involved in cell wall biosynthesis